VPYQASRSTDDGACLIEGTPVHVSTHVTVPIELLIKDAPVLTMDGPFNVDTVPELLAASTTDITNSLSMDDMLVAARRFTVLGTVDINNGLLKSTSDHIHIAKRDGVWKARSASALQLGDKLYHVSGIEIEITSLVVDGTIPCVVYKLDIEPNDTFFANGILTHNKKIGLCDSSYGPEICDRNSPCYDPCNPWARDFGCDWDCGGPGGPKEI
jgi:hypothetical protein